jgi:hypothetical protein
MYTDFLGGRWYKGNLHAHTTHSDGRVAPEETIARYRHSGYDFLAISDHWVPSMPPAEPRDGLLLLPGCEYDTVYTEPYYEKKRQVIIHINGIGFTSIPKLEKSPDLRGQAIIDAIRAAGGIATFNHPAWSHNIPADIGALKGLAGVEIYNTLCGHGRWHYADSSWYLDQLALGGLLFPAMASDDAHYYTGEECRSFMMVRSEKFDREHLLEAISSGHFYASQGPWVQAALKDRTVKVTCTPAAEIRIFDGTPNGRFRDTALLTGAEYVLEDGVSWYRVEVIDERGKRAWTSPVAVGRDSA